MSELLVYVTLLLVGVSVFGVCYVAAAIAARGAAREKGLIVYTIGCCAVIGILSNSAAVFFNGSAAWLLLPFARFLVPVCVLASGLVEMRERQTKPGVRRALTVGAPLLFAVAGIGILALVVLAGASMNPDGHHVTR